MTMNRVTGPLVEVAREYRAGLALVGVILALGWLMQPSTPVAEPDFLASLHSAYVQTGPCGETRVPPSR
jgi:hypothetical protein